MAVDWKSYARRDWLVLVDESWIPATWFPVGLTQGVWKRGFCERGGRGRFERVLELLTGIASNKRIMSVVSLASWSILSSFSLLVQSQMLLEEWLFVSQWVMVRVLHTLLRR